MLDRNDVVVEVHLLANAREVPKPMNDIAADRGHIPILPLQTRQVPHLINAQAAVYPELVFAEGAETLGVPGQTRLAVDRSPRR